METRAQLIPRAFLGRAVRRGRAYVVEHMLESMVIQILMEYVLALVFGVPLALHLFRDLVLRSFVLRQLRWDLGHRALRDLYDQWGSVLNASTRVGKTPYLV